MRLVSLYGAIPSGSPAQNQADPALSPVDDILGRVRTTPDLGAFEATTPMLSIEDLAVVEGDAGSSNAVFTVRLSAVAGATVTVNWATGTDTATPGADYTTSSGALAFSPGITSQTLSVPILGDTLAETDETFTVNLSGAVNAPIADGQAVGTILDDESLAYHTIAPCRLADTRGAAGPSGGPGLGANTTRAFPATGRCGIPATAKAVAVNVAVTGATAAGNLRLYPADHPLPLASTINFAAGQTRGNNAIVRVGTAGSIGVRCVMSPGPGAQTHFILDAFGYFE